MTSAPFPVPPPRVPRAVPPIADQWRRDRRRGLATAVLVVLTTFTAVGQVAFASNAADASGSTAGLWWARISLLVALGAPYLLLVRRRHPVLVAALTAGLTLVSAIDPLLALVALGGLVARRRDRSVLWCTALTALATAVAYLRDIWRPVQGSVWKTVATPDSPVTTSTPDLVVPAWTVLIVLVVAIGMSVGAGLLLRASGELAATRAEREHEREAISSERSRQHERDAVAREAHDTLGHQLTLLALHAGALESADEAEPEVRRKLAGQIRSLASGALRDVRGLVDSLRDPHPSAAVAERSLTADGREIGLDVLPDLLADSRRAGMVIDSNVWLTDASALNPVHGRAVYRIVQEALTNARKHAPGQTVQVEVVVKPTTGVDVSVVNAMPGSATPGTGGTGGRGTTSPASPAGGSATPPAATTSASNGRGLAGIGERAALLGGTARYGVDPERRFRLTVHLPWDAVQV